MGRSNCHWFLQLSLWDIALICLQIQLFSCHVSFKCEGKQQQKGQQTVVKCQITYYRSLTINKYTLACHFTTRSYVHSI